VNWQFGFFVFALASVSSAADVQRIPLPSGGEISQASVFVWRGEEGVGRLGPRSPAKTKGVLVLCPGQNGSSEGFLREKIWQEFAEREGFALVGFQFVSGDEDLKNGRGYFVASRGSGKLLEEGLAKAGLAELPVFLYGFSGGAHFAMSVAAWRPERVAAFCAYSFAWWKAPPEELKCPALIVCGQEDGTRYGASLAYFQAGRGQGKRWAWVSLEGKAHEPSAELDEFVRRYFSKVVRHNGAERHSQTERLPRRGEGETESKLHQSSRRDDEGGKGAVSVDNMTEKIVVGDRANDVGVSVLPSADLLPEWRKLHHP
jgi:predicted esterase